ncbi:hypothetical protein LGQ02_11955 [Bacillus shivajii]|uniref:hypothetical protein n=1 Tax=Bacillus shivajii TaxID=1983719 RepID=UPI001CFA63D9|nr:hypothetical protein [Bacillus shivajii]UCZ51584.1 hypothetical protein LGQ02_11955 [Bacillus shivajii]
MAFGIKKEELHDWKEKAESGQIAFLTHYWYDERFPQCHTVTKVACSNRMRLIWWGKQYGLKQEWIHERNEFPHFDLLGETQKKILQAEGLEEQLKRFKLL